MSVKLADPYYPRLFRRDLDVSAVPAHLMDDDFDNMELHSDGPGVAKLEVKDYDKAFKTFYNIDDLEDVDD